MRGHRVGIAAEVALLAVAILPFARAQEPDDLKRAVARISFINAEVSVQRGDSGEWVAASINSPLLTGDRITTAPNSRAEIEFDSGNILRMGGEAVVTVSQLEYGRYQLALGRGTVTFRILRPSNTDIELDTPSVSVRPSKQGTYRISVTDAGDSEVTARAGDVEVFTPRGTQWVPSGQTMVAHGTTSDPEFRMVAALPYDEWDRWCDSRDQQITASQSSQYVPPGVYGAEDLDPYGSWTNVPSYGYVWRPVVAPGWAPYQSGRWVWEDWYGWTWVSYEPWGWAPYHYGRWFFEPAYGWCWYPGGIGVRHYWSPALVAFFGFGGGGVSFGFGNVGWVPLAPYEVLHPWWGRGFYGRPEYFNRSVNIVNVNVFNTYRNARVTNGFTAVSNADFRSGRFNNFVRASGADLRQANFARGPIPVAPDRANLRFSGQAAYVPRSTGANRVFSYRQPSPAQRVPFGQPNRAAEGPQNFVRSESPGARFGATANPQGPATAPRNGAGGWQRFGEPRAVPNGSSMPRAESAAPSNNRGWSRFGEPMGTPRQESRPQPAAPAQPNVARPSAPSEGFRSGGQPQSLRVIPPVVRERPDSGMRFGASAPQNRVPNGGNFRGPSGGGGGFSAPRAPSGGGGFSAPRAPSGGGFSAPRAPSGGGGGGGGGHASHGGGGGGGGGHRGR